MAEDNAASKPSWHEREITLALQRLANARAQLALLEEQGGAAAPAAEPVDPADLARATELQADIAKLTSKASGRFGASSARAKLEVAERELQALLERHGAGSVADLQADRSPAAAAVDPTMLDFARRECADAEKAFLEVAAMVIPEDDDADAHDDGPDAEVIAAADSFADGGKDLDLRIEPSAAS
jgi:hypothetical protein